MLRRAVVMQLVFAISVVIGAAPADARRGASVQSYPAVPCTDDTSVNSGADNYRVTGGRDCGSADARADGSRRPATRVFDCGPPSPLTISTLATPDDECRTAEVDCAVPAGRVIDPSVTTIVVIVQRADNSWVVGSVDCAFHTDMLTPLLIRAEVIRLLPAVPVRSAPVDGYTLVNLKTVVWVQTPSQRPLGPVTLLGHRVRIEITASSVRWNFGDGTLVHGPLGQPFGTDCRGRECPGFWGHDYTRTGTPLVTAAVSWTARYAVDGGGWAVVPGGVVTGVATALRLVVRQARAVLVADPNER
jgi:hypothetical protein